LNNVINVDAVVAAPAKLRYARMLTESLATLEKIVPFNVTRYWLPAHKRMLSRRRTPSGVVVVVPELVVRLPYLMSTPVLPAAPARVPPTASHEEPSVDMDDCPTRATLSPMVGT
jgi:hypothetical protein